MLVTLDFNKAWLTTTEGEDISIFTRASQEIRYHLYNGELKKKTGYKFDPNNLQVLEAYIDDPYSRAYNYQNYLCYLINKIKGDPLKYNFKRGKWFGYMNDGWVSPIKYNKKKKHVEIRTGWIRSFCTWFSQAYPENDIFFDDLRTSEKPYLQFKSPRSYNLEGKVEGFQPRSNQVDVVDALIDPFVGITEQGIYDPARAEMAKYLLTGVLLNEAVNSGKTSAAGIIYDNIVDPIAMFPFVKQDAFAATVCSYLEMGFNVSVISADGGLKKINQIRKFKGIENAPNIGEFGDLLFVMIPTYEARCKSTKSKPVPLYDGTELDKYNVGFFDEAQELVSETCERFLDRTRLMLKVAYTGTSQDSPDRAKRASIRGWFGKPLHSRTVAENVAAGYSLEPHVHFYLNAPVVHTKSGIAENYIYKGEERLNILRHVLDKYKGKSIFIYTGYMSIERSDFIYELLCDEYDKVGYGHGKRDAILHMNKFIGGEYDILLGNQVYRKALNMPNIEVFVMLEPTDNRESIIQAPIGRSIRLNGEEDKVLIIEFWDRVHGFLNRSIFRRDVYQSPRIGAKLKFFNQEYEEVKSLEN